MSRLATPPSSVVLDGAPAQGRYAGCIDRLDWRGLGAAHRRGPLWMRLHHKRWHYVGIGNERLFIGVAIVDIGWTGTAFAYLFDRAQRRLLADWSQDGLPGLQVRIGDAPLRGARASFRGWRSRLDLQERDDVLQLQVEIPGLRLQAELAMPQSPPLLAIGPIADGIAHATLKTTAMRVQGWAEAGGERFLLDDATAALDASNGLLARDTAWRWASAHSPQLGFNLQQGYFGAQENALWLDGELIPLAAADFVFDPKAPLAPWRLRTEDGLLELRFTPEGLRAEDRNLGIAASHYVQPIGRFDGFVRASTQAPAREVRHLLGVTEDHRSRW